MRRRLLHTTRWALTAPLPFYGLGGYSPDSRRSLISCWRNGILSMDRDNSRTLQGAGLRNATRPSLPTSAIMYPRGRSSVRTSLNSLLFVSVMMITSRTANCSTSANNKSICCRKRGSLGVSAKITNGRATQLRSSNTISDPSKTCVRSSSQRSRMVWSCAAAGRAINAASAMFVNSFITLDIEALAPKAKGQLQLIANNCVSVPFIPAGGANV